MADQSEGSEATEIAVFTVPGFEVRPLGVADEAAIQDLTERTSDYTILVEGQPPQPDAARHFLEMGAPGWETTRITKLGLFDRNGTLQGIVDAAVGYSDDTSVYLGLLLLDPAQRGQGIGARCTAALETWVRAHGKQRLLLSVLEANPRAHAFWRRLGFRDLRTLPARQFGQRMQVQIEMEKRLD